MAHRSTSTGKMVMNEEQLIMEEMINDRPVQLHCSGTGQSTQRKGCLYTHLKSDRQGALDLPLACTNTNAKGFCTRFRSIDLLE